MGTHERAVSAGPGAPSEGSDAPAQVQFGFGAACLALPLADVSTNVILVGIGMVVLAAAVACVLWDSAPPRVDPERGLASDDGQGTTLAARMLAPTRRLERPKAFAQRASRKGPQRTPMDPEDEATLWADTLAEVDALATLHRDEAPARSGLGEARAEPQATRSRAIAPSRAAQANASAERATPDLGEESWTRRIERLKDGTAFQITCIDEDDDEEDLVEAPLRRAA